MISFLTASISSSVGSVKLARSTSGPVSLIYTRCPSGPVPLAHTRCTRGPVCLMPEAVPSYRNFHGTHFAVPIHRTFRLTETSMTISSLFLVKGCSASKRLPLCSLHLHSHRHALFPRLNSNLHGLSCGFRVRFYRPVFSHRCNLAILG